MPRRGKGQKAQAVTDVYGEGIDSIEAQKAIPLPDNTAPAPAPEGAPAIPAQAKLQAALSQAAEMTIDQGNTLTAPTNRPGEPVTSGLPVGPGAGPEGLAKDPSMPTNVASVTNFFTIAADVFGQDPTMAALANRAQQRGI